MNLFGEIEGRDGEELTSAILRFLILRSQDVRETFRRLVSKHSKQGPILMREEFSCRSEVYTLDEKGSVEHPQGSGSGRIDLLIQTDNAVIGVENKLDAPFQEGQPEKYLSTLKRLANPNGSSQRARKYVLVILGPESRYKEITGMISGLNESSHYVVLTWKELRDELHAACFERADKISQAVIDQLCAYIDDRLAFWPEELHLNHLKGSFDSQGVHGDFIRKLTGIFPQKQGTRLGTGLHSTGYHLDVGERVDSNKEEEIAWLGFVAKDAVSQGANNPTELIFVTTIAPPIEPSSSIRRITLKNEWWKHRPFHAWAIDYDENWKSPDVWRNRLQSFL